MTKRAQFRVSAFFIFALAVFFYFFFMHTKHDAALSAVNPFADDPYDAIGSFGIQAAVFLGILGLIRAFRLNRPATVSPQRELFLVRVQMAAILSVGVTLAADAVAMLRHPSLWVGTPAGYRLLAWLAGMAILTAAVGAPVHRIAKRMELPATSSARSKTAVVSLLAVFILLVYPENFRSGLIGALFTAGVGTPILFACIWAWATALIPFRADQATEAPQLARRWYARTSFQWAVVILAGVLIGLFFVAGEASEGTGIPRAKLALVVSTYIGLESLGVVIGYWFLRKPLGLFRKFS